MKLVTLDTETLSAKTNATILEVGIIGVEVDRYSEIFLDEIWNHVSDETQWQRGDNWSLPSGSWTTISPRCKALRMPLPLAQQCAIGRDIDANTMTWHSNTPEKAENFKRMFKAATVASDPIIDYLKAIVTFCEDADEIWINGLSFDPTILKTLAESVKFQEPLWVFRKETDVRSFYRVFDVNADVSPYRSHDSINDCVRNLATMLQLGLEVENRGLKFRTKLPYTKQEISK